MDPRYPANHQQHAQVPHGRSNALQPPPPPNDPRSTQQPQRAHSPALQTKLPPQRQPSPGYPTYPSTTSNGHASNPRPVHHSSQPPHPPSQPQQRAASPLRMSSDVQHQQLTQQLGRVNLSNGDGKRDTTQPSFASNDASSLAQPEGPSPARSKRFARAYHKPDQAPQSPQGQVPQQPLPSSQPEQQQHPSYHSEQHQHQQHYPARFDNNASQRPVDSPTYTQQHSMSASDLHDAQQQQQQHIQQAHPYQQDRSHPQHLHQQHQQQNHHLQTPHTHAQAPYQNAPPASGPTGVPSNSSGYNSNTEPGIPQPPHSAGQRIPGKMRVRIDPDHIPSPVAVQDIDQQLYRDEPYMTCSRMAAPLSTTEFIAIDQGNCNPRFMRMTTYNLPSTDDLAVASQLPLGLVVQPFALLREEESAVPLVESGESGPTRCQRCRGYVNPWCSFIEGGQKFVCNLCGATSEVSPEYFSHLDMSQRRMDLDQRPELRLGSVDFAVGKDYWVQDNPTQPGSSPRQPQPMHYIFAIDVSWTSMRCGLVGEVVKGIRELLYPDDEAMNPGLPTGAKVALMTFDRSVQFYNLKAGLDQAQMLVVSDITDMFVPLLEGFLVDPIDSRAVIEGLLDTLPSLTTDTAIVEAALSGPVMAAIMSLKHIGGQLNVFQTSLPTIGIGALKHREDSKLYGTDKEKTLFLPQDPWYRATAEECVEAGIGVNMFLFPTQYIDVASLGVLSGLTGGEVFFHPRFSPVRDGTKLRAEIRQVVRRETGSCVTMRIRCSNGLRVSDHFGNFFQRNVTDLEFGSIDADKAIAARLKHESKLDDKVDAYFQCAVLYTASSGQRRVRVHNLAVPVTSLLANVFRFADMDTTLAYVTKEAVTQTATKSLRQVRDHLTELCVKALLAYRKHCASSTSPAQLILPESFKLFPLYALALMKSKALKGGPVASDVRTWSMRAIKSLGVAATVRLLYPRFLAIHNLPDEIGFPDERGHLRLPPLIRTSYARMEPHGVYLIENGEFVIIWLGASVSPQILQDLYGVESLEELDTRMIRNILALFERQAGGKVLSVLIARQNIDGTEIEFSNMLVEDSNNEQLSYSESLCHIHSLIQSDLMGESKKDFDVSSFTTW